MAYLSDSEDDDDDYKMRCYGCIFGMMGMVIIPWFLILLSILGMPLWIVFSMFVSFNVP